MSRFRRWLAPPVYPDEDDNRVANSLYIVLYTCGVIIGIFLLPTLSLRQSALTFNVFAIFAAIVAAWLALRARWKPRLIARIVLAVFFLAIFLAGLLTGGVGSTGFNAQVVILVIVAMLLTPRDIVIFTLLNILAVGSIGFLDQIGILNAIRVIDVPQQIEFTRASLLLLTGLMLYLAVRYFNQLVRRSSAQAELLAQRNAELEREIAQRKGAQEREARLASILETTSDIVGMSDLEGNAIYLNAASRAKFGVANSDQMRKRNIAEFHPPWAAKIVLDVGIPAAIEQGIWTGETAIVTDTGEERQVSQVIIAHRNDDHEVVYLSTIIRDLSERKRIEDALRASEQRLKLAMQVARMGTWDWDINTGVDHWDEATHKLFDVEIGAFETTVEAFAARVDSADQAAVATMLAKCRETGAPFDLEYRTRLRNGQTRWLHSLGHTYFDELGKPSLMIGVVQDITERKEAEEALRANQHRLKLAMQMARLGMWDWDIETDVEIWDEMTHNLFGVSVGAFNTTMEVFNALVDPNDQQAVEAMTARSRETGDPFDIEYRVNHVDGQTRWMHSLGQIYYDATGKPRHMLGVVQDITERKQAQQHQLELSLERERVQLLKDFLHTMSHDLKTPLSTIQTSLYLLERAAQESDRQRRIGIIKEQVTQLDKMIHDILTLARLDHTPQLKIGSVDINQVIESSAQQLHAAAERKHIDVRLDLQAAVKPIAGDKGEIQRVMINLIENALNYTPEDGHVRIRTYAMPDRAAIEIEDTGMGIQPDALPHIFERFYRANEARSSVEGGTGLGLAIVKQIIEMHRGQIEVESEAGRGTTFRVKLPLHPVLSSSA